MTGPATITIIIRDDLHADVKIACTDRVGEVMTPAQQIAYEIGEAAQLIAAKLRHAATGRR